MSYSPTILLLALTTSLYAKDKPPLPAVVAQLQTKWRDDLSQRESFKAHHGQLAEQLFEPKRISVLETTGQRAFERVNGTLAATERKLILFGDLDQLRKQTRLQEVHNPGTLGNGFSAYLNLKGELILLWIIPEG